MITADALREALERHRRRALVRRQLELVLDPARIVVPGLVAPRLEAPLHGAVRREVEAPGLPESRDLGIPEVDDREALLALGLGAAAVAVEAAPGERGLGEQPLAEGRLVGQPQVG